MNTTTLPVIARPNFLNFIINFCVFLSVVLAIMVLSHFLTSSMTEDFPLKRGLETYELVKDEISAVVMLVEGFSLFGAVVLIGSVLFFTEVACHRFFGKIIFNFKRRIGTEWCVSLDENHIGQAKSIFEKNGISFDRQTFNRHVSQLNNSGNLYFGYHTFGPVYFHVIGGDVSNTGRRRLIVGER